MPVNCSQIDVRYDSREDRLLFDLVGDFGTFRYSVTARLARSLVRELAKDVKYDDWRARRREFSTPSPRPINDYTKNTDQTTNTRVLLERIDIQRAGSCLILVISSGVDDSHQLKLSRPNEILLLEALFLTFVQAGWELNCWPNFLAEYAGDSGGRNKPVH